MNKSEVRFSPHTHRCTLINCGCYLAEWIKNINGTAWRAFSPPLDARLYHTDSPRLADTVGSCSMLPREKQGVVDSELKVLTFFPGISEAYIPLCVPQVYGTTNVRVADLSIIPMHIAAHTQGVCPRIPGPPLTHVRRFYVAAAAYVIGEKGMPCFSAGCLSRLTSLSRRYCYRQVPSLKPFANRRMCGDCILCISTVSISFQSAQDYHSASVNKRVRPHIPQRYLRNSIDENPGSPRCPSRKKYSNLK